MVFAVVTGGGTSGHVIPAQSIIELLRESGVDVAAIKYVGSRRGMETSLMSNSDVESVFLPISGLQRSLSPRSIMRNAALLWRLPRSLWLARRLIKKWQPRVVVSVGGYASEPVARAARRYGVPLVCVSYDRIAGLATRRQGRYATVCAVAFADTKLPRAVHTGAPVRAELRHLDRNAERDHARDELGIDRDAMCLTIVGGSLGSGVLNNAVTAIAAAVAHVGNVVIYHVCGVRNLEDEPPSVSSGVGYIRCGYETRMAQLYAATDVLIGRAGASTVAEIATVGIASVVVPWRGAAENHQELNAQWLADSHAAIVISEDDLSQSRGHDVIVDLLQNRAKREQLATHAFALGALHRGKTLLEVIQNAAR